MLVRSCNFTCSARIRAKIACTPNSHIAIAPNTGAFVSLPSCSPMSPIAADRPHVLQISEENVAQRYRRWQKAVQRSLQLDDLVDET